MELVTYALVALPIAYFLIQSFAERRDASTAIRFYQYGEPLGHQSFFATMVSSTTGLLALYLIAVYGYLYGLGVFPWLVGFWVLTQTASLFAVRRADRALVAQGGLSSGRFTLHEILGELFDCPRPLVLNYAL